MEQPLRRFIDVIPSLVNLKMVSVTDEKESPVATLALQAPESASLRSFRLGGNADSKARDMLFSFFALPNWSQLETLSLSYFGLADMELLEAIPLHLRNSDLFDGLRYAISTTREFATFYARFENLETADLPLVAITDTASSDPETDAITLPKVTTLHAHVGPGSMRSPVPGRWLHCIQAPNIQILTVSSFNCIEDDGRSLAALCLRCPFLQTLELRTSDIHAASLSKAWPPLLRRLALSVNVKMLNGIEVGISALQTPIMGYKGIVNANSQPSSRPRALK